MTMPLMLDALAPAQAQGGFPAWLGDVPTWLAVIGAGITAWVALRQFSKQTRILERTQADQVDLDRRSTVELPPAMPLSRPTYQRCCLAVVYNGSGRPIRSVTCKIELAPGQGIQAATQVGQPLPDRADKGRPWRFHGRPVEGSSVALIRIKETHGFSFPYWAEEYPAARVTARFTDDAGLHWQIDHDLHLKRLRRRRW